MIIDHCTGVTRCHIDSRYYDVIVAVTMYSSVCPLFLTAQNIVNLQAVITACK